MKGQETTISVVAGGQLRDELGNVQSFDFEDEYEMLKEGYLGEFSQRFDEVFMGVTGKMEIHLSKAEYFQFRQMIKDRAQRKTPDVQFNITSVVSFPNGQVKTILFPDVKFGNLSHTFPSRKDYAKVSMSFGTSDTVDSDG